MCSSGVVRVVHFLYVCGCWDTPSPGLFDPGYVSLIYVYIMAIINSLAIGKSVKSAGNLTYKTVRGRTIASQRITTNKSNTPLQASQRSKFSQVSQAMTLVQSYINNFYEKSKYGSARNSFFRENPNFTMGGLVGEVKEGVTTLADGMLASLSAIPVKELLLVSKGTLPGILQASYIDFPNYKFNQITYENPLRIVNWVDDSAEQLCSYEFTTPVKLADLKLLCFVVSASSSFLYECTEFDSGSFSTSGNVPNDADVITTARVSFTDDTNQFVKSIEFGFSLAAATGSPYAFAIAVPSVGGKVPSLSGIFITKPAG